MSRASIRNALEDTLKAMAPPLATAWENAAFTPVEGVAYQRVWFIWPKPENSELGRGFVDRGTLQVTLVYPIGTGPKAAEGRADDLRNTFFRGASFTADGLTTSITDTPEIATGAIVDGRYLIPVRIPFRAAYQS
jgi:hypothetical protein